MVNDGQRENEPHSNGISQSNGNSTAPASPESNNGDKMRPSKKISIRGVPLHLRYNDLKPLLTPHGKILNCDAVNSPHSQHQTIYITFERQDQAQKAAESLDGIEMDGTQLRVKLVSRRRYRPLENHLPLRMLVPSDLMGSIIGHKGSTIKEIVRKSNAQIDLRRKENIGTSEKDINIIGNAKDCNSACKLLLEVMQKEADKLKRGVIHLKMLIHNNFVGRLIGKEGKSLKGIMKESETNIVVSSVLDVHSFNFERTITIKGELDNMVKAEALITEKLRQFYLKDIQASPIPENLVYTSAHGCYYGLPPSYSHPYYDSKTNWQDRNNSYIETTAMYVPNNAAGAIIGTYGTYIRDLVRSSGASVKISNLEPDDDKTVKSSVRRLTIVGKPEAQWKAQYLIFEKMKEKQFTSDDIPFTVELMIPANQVGRLVGKQGQNIRELQRLTGTLIKVPGPGEVGSTDKDVGVQLTGLFSCVQSAQRRIRTMMLPMNMNGRRSPIEKSMKMNNFMPQHQQSPQPQACY